MPVQIPEIVKHHKFWFYCRKALFQGFFPILLGFLTFYDLSKQTINHPSSHLYYYTSFILFIYANLKIILEYVFSVCSDDVVFRKEIDLTKTTSNLAFAFNLTDSPNENFIIIIKKIFKLRYSSSSFFKRLDQLCWFLGVDSPLLIPQSIVNKMANVFAITPSNEQMALHQTLNNLYAYHPTQYSNINDISDDMPDIETNLLSQNKIIGLDKIISQTQKDLFGAPDQ